MVCSTFQRNANRLNASKSTGPKTAEGKARSRLNSYKHGLTGSGIALPKEDAAEVQERFEALESEIKPRGVLARILVQRVALCSIRLERSARHETVALSEKIRAAEGAFVEARTREVDRMFDRLNVEPGAMVRGLRRMPEGIERLISGWIDLRGDLIREGGGFWSGAHSERAESLAGRAVSPYKMYRFRALDAGLTGDPTWLDPADLAHGDLRAWCRDEIARMIDAEVAKLRGELSALDLGDLARDRAEAADRALFDPSQEAILARRYEAANERAMYKALDRIEAIREQVVADDPAEPDVEAVSPPIDESAEAAETDSPPSLPKQLAASFFPIAPTSSGMAKPPAEVPSKSAATPIDRAKPGPRR